MNFLRINSQLRQGVFYVKDHLFRPAQKKRVDVCRAEKQAAVGAAFVAVQAALEKFAAQRFAAEDVVDGKPVGVQVFQFFQLFPENDVVKTLVSVKQ